MKVYDINGNEKELLETSEFNKHFIYDMRNAINYPDLLEQKSKMISELQNGYYFLYGGWQGNSYGSGIAIKQDDIVFMLYMVGESLFYSRLYGDAFFYKEIS